MSRAVLGDAPAFPVPDYALASPLELPLFLGLGLVCAFASLLFTRVFVGAENLFSRIRLHPMLRPAVGGLAVGLLALAVPRVLGRGYETIGELLQGNAAPVALIGVWVVAKLLASGASFGSWGSGGIFAPVLFVGAGVGAAFGQLVAPLGEMAIDRVVAEVGLAADEPFAERRIGVVEDRVRLPVPVDRLRLFRPERLGFLDRAPVEVFVAHERLRMATRD